MSRGKYERHIPQPEGGGDACTRSYAVKARIPTFNHSGSRFCDRGDDGPLLECGDGCLSSFLVRPGMQGVG